MGLNIDELYERRQEIDLRIAFAEMRQEEAEDIIAAVEDDAELASEADEFYNETRFTIEKKISRAITRIQMRNARKALAPVARVAAYILLFFYIGLSTAIAASPDIRNQFMQFLINIGSEYTELEFRETGESFDVPNEWQGDYYLSHIPDGYSLFTMDGSESNNVVTYTDENDNGMAFSECGIDTLSNINTEGADISYVNINGRSIFSARKEKFSIYTWAEFDRYFILSFSGKTDIAEEVLGGILRIR